MNLWPIHFYCEIRSAVFSKAECQEIIDMHKRYPTASGHLERARECTLFWVHRDPDSDWVFERITTHVCEYNRPYRLDVEPGAETGLQLSRYEPGERYDWHMDVGAHEASRRKISVLIELVDPHEHCGGFEVFYGEGRDNRIPLRAGDAAIFPSYVMHRAVTPMIGVRWTLAAWIKGPHPFR